MNKKWCWALPLAITCASGVWSIVGVTREGKRYDVDRAGILRGAADSVYMVDGRVMFALALNYTFVSGSGCSTTEYTSACDRDQAQEYVWNCLLSRCAPLTVYYDTTNNESRLTPYDVSGANGYMGILVISVICFLASACAAFTQVFSATRGMSDTWCTLA